MSNTIEEIQERRAARRAALYYAPRKAQEERDLLAIDGLEEDRGECLFTLDAEGYVPGVPVKMAFRPASALEYKRYVDLVTRASEKTRALEVRKAQDQLARACVIYPATKEECDAFFAAFPGALVSLAIAVTERAELRKADEGKD